MSKTQLPTKTVRFKIIETRGMPHCRKAGDILPGHLHSTNCPNFQCDGKSIVGERYFEDRRRELERMEERDRWIEELFQSDSSDSSDCFTKIVQFFFK